MNNEFNEENEQSAETSKRERTQNGIYFNLLKWLDKNRVSYIWTVASIITGFAFIVLTVLTVLSVSANNKKIDDLSIKNNAMKLQVDEYKSKISTENNNYLGKMLLRLLPEDKLASLTKENWAYKLSVNGKQVSKTNNVYVETPTVEITITETQKQSDLPAIVNVKGSITGGEQNSKYSDFITVTATTSKYVAETKDEAAQKSTTYKFTDLKVGEIITIQLDPNLATRLDLSENIVEIFYAKKATEGK